MRHIISLRTRQNGDTIVEVLIVIALLSLVLAAAFVTSNRSLQTVQDAGEHGEAQNAISGQIEILQSVDQTTIDTIFNQTDKSNFCFAQNGANAYARYDLGGTDARTIPSLASDQLSSPTYPTQCQNGRYFLSITYDKNQGDLFTLRARWDALRGGRNEVEMFYRYHSVVTSVRAGPSPPPPPSVVPCVPPTDNFSGMDVAKKRNGDPVSHIWYTPSYSNATWAYTLTAAQRADFQAGCETQVSITVGDPGHPTTDVQNHESLFAVFKDAGGNTLCVTNPTPDLPDSQPSMGPINVGSCTFYQVPTRIIFTHCSLYDTYVSSGTSIATACKDSKNSVNPVAISFSSP